MLTDTKTIDLKKKLIEHKCMDVPYRGFTILLRKNNLTSIYLIKNNLYTFETNIIA